MTATSAIALENEMRRRLDATAAALESARRVSRAMTTLIAAREAKQIDRRLVGAILEATPYRRAGLLDPPTPSIAARLRFVEGADDVAPLEIIGVPVRSPLAPGVALHRLVAGEETDLVPLHFGMLGRGAVVPLHYDGHTAAYAYADAYDGSIPIDEAERALTDLVQAAALSRANAALLAERDHMIGEARNLARVDPLTGLPNRTAFVERLESELARFKRHATPVALAIVDLDHFKAVNDTLGHAAGDAALERFANALRTTARDSDLVVRFAGDEFAVILVETEEDVGVRAMDRALVAIRMLTLTASIGVAQALPDDTAKTLFERADKALYAAKEGGRDRVVAASRLLIGADGAA